MKESSNNSRMTSSVRAVIGAEVLVIDKDENVRAGIAKLAAEAKMNATCVADPSDAWELLKKRFFSVAVVDLDTPHPNAGIDTVTSIQMISKTTSILVLTPRKSYDSALEVLRAGASDVVHKSPESVAYLRDKLIVAAGRSQQQRQLTAILQEASGVHETFLQLLMKAEREVVDLQDTIAKRDPASVGGELRILVVDRSTGFAEELDSLAPAGYVIEHVQSGGEALDRGSTTMFHFAMVSHDLPDLPQSMVARSLKSQSPELVALSYRGPGDGGSVEIAEAGPGAMVVPEFSKTEQLVERLPDLGEAFRAKEQQRRYTQAFRAKHYDFVRKFVSFKEKLDDVGE
jgi:DNA-binding response OmpR family regulator